GMSFVKTRSGTAPSPRKGGASMLATPFSRDTDITRATSRYRHPHRGGRREAVHEDREIDRSAGMTEGFHHTNYGPGTCGARAGVRPGEGRGPGHTAAV